MRGKLAGLVGIFAVALALGLGAAVEQDHHADGTKGGHSVLADTKGPGVAPTNPPTTPPATPTGA
ncbi:hypothetical protein ADK52_23855 [Streptomyces sp. WM6372]|uniref:hypothetical protein n=1 Tax=Streptomyces sp. WM6372 TaxID=1415555 RepID=UPI0006AE12D8|nr:hypothetical protein [Streptomyces sp. WM6372]KOU21398.1 hypothetical protein ADK52_23855 [Streptomyces sp. WM6372]